MESQTKRNEVDMIKKLFQLYRLGVENIQKLNWLPNLLARISLGSIFTLSGWGKLHHLDQVTGFFTQLGIPFPEFNAGFVGATEFGFGILILLGLLTRLAAIPLIITMTVAIATAKRPEIEGLTDVLGFEEFIYIVIFIWLMIQGAGKVSLDHFFDRKCGPKKNG